MEFMVVKYALLEMNWAAPRYVDMPTPSRMEDSAAKDMGSV
jgi:hypothetical protein